MALKVKAVEKKIKFSKEDPGVYRYVMQPDLYIALSQAKVIKEAALRSIKECLSPCEATLFRYYTASLCIVWPSSSGHHSAQHRPQTDERPLSSD